MGAEKVQFNREYNGEKSQLGPLDTQSHHVLNLTSQAEITPTFGPRTAGMQLMLSQHGLAWQRACVLTLACPEEQGQQFGNSGPWSTSGGCSHGNQPWGACRVILRLENRQLKAIMS